MTPSDTPHARFRILIADDDPADAIRLEGMLRDAGYKQVRATTDLREVADFYAKWPFDLLLIDMAGDVDGYGVIVKLSANMADMTGGDADAPIILALLEDSRRESQERALVAGARDFIVRPFDRPEVVSRVRNMLDLQGARRITAG